MNRQVAKIFYQKMKGNEQFAENISLMNSLMEAGLKAKDFDVFFENCDGLISAEKYFEHNRTAKNLFILSAVAAGVVEAETVMLPQEKPDKVESNPKVA